MRAIVCGSRNATDLGFVFRSLDHIDSIRRIECIIEGGQRKRKDGAIIGGIDYFAFFWAIDRGRRVETYAAEWYPKGRMFGYDRSAGPRRNRLMLTKSPDVLIAFPGGPGTKDMIAAASRIDLPTWPVLDDGSVLMDAK